MKKVLMIMLCTMAAITYGQFGIRHARGLQCTSNLKQIGLGLAMHLENHGNRLPGKLEDARENIPAGIRICPNSKKSYIYLGNIKGNNKGSIPVVMDRIGNHPGQINVLMQDGHVKTIRHNARNYRGLLSYFKGLTSVQKQQLSKILKKLDSGK